MPTLPILILPGTLCTGAMFSHQITQLSQYSHQISVVQFTDEATLPEMAASVIKATGDQPCAIMVSLWAVLLQPKSRKLTHI